MSRRGDAAEVEADRAASVVARGGSVASWSFSAVPTADSSVHREDGAVGGAKGDEEKKKKDNDRKEMEEAAKKTGEALLETKPAKKMIEELEKQPVVKRAKEIASSTPGKISLGAAAAGAVAASLATDTPIPDALLPAFPIPGLPPSIKAEGKVYVRGRSSFGIGISGTFGHAPKTTWKRPAGSRVESPEARQAEINAQLMQSIQQGQQGAGDSDAWERAMAAKEFARRNILVPVLPGPTPASALPLGPRRTAGEGGGTGSNTGDRAGEESEQPKKKEDDAPVQREAVGLASPGPTGTEAPDGESVQANVDHALGSGGRPLDRSTRRFMESRFGVDFAGVRLHDDSRAIEAAQGLDARAFTVDQHVVLGRGVDVEGPHGRRLLAHELAHVVQQSRAEPATMPLQRLGAGDWIGVFLGISEGNWSDEELRDYLELVSSSDAIEGRFHSDNKARAIVRRWRKGDTAFDLSPRQRVLLIDEMIDGPTLIEDETAILDLLVFSDSHDLREMVGPGQVTLAGIDSDIDDDRQRERLEEWLTTRFEGGRKAVASGKIEVKDTPPPSEAPTFGFSAEGLDRRIESARSVEEVISLIDGYSEADRAAALQELMAVRRPKLQAAQDAIIAELVAAAGKQPVDEKEVDAIRERLKKHREMQLRTERILLHFFHGAIPATEADLRSGTKATDPADRSAIRESLRPEVKRTSSGAAKSFVETVTGESTTYAQKLEALLPDIIDRAWDSLVKDKGHKEHQDQSKMHTLAEFERIGRRATKETDLVFGEFSKGAELKASGRHRNLFDQFVETQKDLWRMTFAQKRDMARELCFYFFRTRPQVAKINADHNAIPEFDNGVPKPGNDAAVAQSEVVTDFLSDAKNVKRCNEIDRGWPATARPSKSQIFFQLFRESDPVKDRLLLWDVFQTFIHEYLHTLAAKEYRDYADTFDDERQENTLIEGVDSLLTEVVWTVVEPKAKDKDLRDAVEGPDYANLTPLASIPHAGKRRYPSYSEALALVDLVGINNLYAAYFLGLVDRIGGPTP